MSFPKAAIKRYYDVENDTPGPGNYDPKLPNNTPHGVLAFDKCKRFPDGRGDKDNKDFTFAIPRTPSFTKKTLERPSTTNSRKGQTKPLKKRNSNSFSLPSGIDQAGLDSDSSSDYEVRKCNNMDLLVSEINAKEQELEEKDAAILRCQSKNMDLAASLASVEEKVKELEKATTEKSLEVETWGQKCQQLEKELQVLKTEAEKEKSDLKKGNEELVASNDKLEQDLQQKIERISTLEGKTLAVEEEMQQVQKHLNETQNQVTLLVQQRDDLSQQLVAYKDEVEDLKRSCSEWEEKLNFATLQYHECAAVLERTQVEYESLKEELAGFTESTKLQEAHMVKCQHELESALKYIDEQAVQLSHSANNISSYELRLSSMMKEAQDKDMQIKILEELVAMKDQEIVGVKSSLKSESGKVLAKGSIIKSLKGEKLKLEQRIEKLRGEQQALEAEHAAEIEALHEEQRRVVEEHNTRIQDMQRESSEVKEDLLSRLAEVQSEKDTLEMALRAEINLNQNEIEELKVSIHDLEETKELLIVDQKSTLDKLNEEKSKLLARTAIEIQELQQEKAKLEENLTDRCKVLLNEKLDLEAAYKKQLETLDSEMSHKMQHLQESASSDLQTLKLKHDQELYRLEASKTQLEQELTERIFALETEQIQLASEHADEVKQLNLDKVKSEQELWNKIAEINAERLKSEQEMIEKLQDCEGKLATELTNYHQEKQKNMELGSALEELAFKASSERAHYEQACQISAKKLENCEIQVAALEIDISRMQQEFSNTCENYRSQLEQSELQIQEYSRSLADANQRIGDIEAQMSSKVARFEKLERDLEASVEKSNQQEKSLEESKKIIDSKNYELEILDKKIAQYTGALMSTESELEDTKAKLEIAEAKIEVTESEVNELQQLLEAEIASNGHRCNEFEQKISECSLHIAELKDNIDLMECQKNMLEAENADLKVVKDTLKSELDQARGEMKQERDNFANIQMEFQEKLDLKEVEIDQQKKNLTEMQSGYSALLTEVSEHAAKLQFSREKLDGYLEKNISFTKAIDERIVGLLIKKLQKLEGISTLKLSKSEEKQKELIHLSQKYKSQSQVFKKQLQTQLSSQKDYEGQLSEKDSQIDHLKAQNAALENLIGPFKDQLKMYKSHLDLEQGTSAKYAELVANLETNLANVVGHHNTKQRIHHLQNLKEEKLALFNENKDLKKQLTIRNTRIHELETKLLKSRRFDATDAFKHTSAKERSVLETKENSQPTI